MKKNFLILIFFFITQCVGYEPIYSSKEQNFYIDTIKTEIDDEISKNIEKKLRPYTKKNEKEKITLKINSTKNEKILSKDNKGDPVILEIEISTNVDISYNNIVKTIKFEEKFSYTNQSNKFEFEQYKKNIEKNLIDKIFDKLIFKLRNINDN